MKMRCNRIKTVLVERKDGMWLKYLDEDAEDSNQLNI